MLDRAEWNTVDCWDGANGEPVIFHGHTLTSKISFLSVCQAIRDYAFVASEYGKRAVMMVVMAVGMIWKTMMISIGIDGGAHQISCDPLLGEPLLRVTTEANGAYHERSVRRYA